LGGDNIRKVLFKKSPDQYGDRYKTDYLEIYKAYVTGADNISARRQSANSFFVTLNTALLAFLGYSKHSFSQPMWRLALLATLAGLVICYTWYRLIRSYKGLNSGKFRVIHLIEENLPLAPYDAEWEAVGRGHDPKKYLPFTHVEIYVPWIFAAIYLIGLLVSIPWHDLRRLCIG
jgi:hypothetical protein